MGSWIDGFKNDPRELIPKIKKIIDLRIQAVNFDPDFRFF